MNLLSTLSMLLLASCASVADLNPLPEKQGRCELRPAKDQCTDWVKFKGPTMATMQGVCTTLQSSLPQDKGKPGGWQEGATCDRAGLLGGCQTSSADGSLQTNWYYLGESYKSEEDAKKQCGSGQSYVAP